jgi:hypothetical protein
LLAAPQDMPQIIIAHSHGGNIALRAIEDLDESRTDIHVVTMATPFLRIFDVKPPSYVLLFLTLFNPIIYALVYSLKYWEPFLPQQSAALFNLTPFIYAALSAAISVWLVRIYFYPGTLVQISLDLDPVRDRNASSTWDQRPFRLADATNFDFSMKSVPLLVIRGVGDEASLTMAAGKIGARLNYLLAKNMIWLVCLAGFVSAIAVAARPSLKDLTHVIGLWINFGLVTVILLPNLFNSVFGREFLIGTSRCEVSAESVPDSASANIVTLKPRETGLRHSVYDSPQTVSAIIEWLENCGVIAKLTE